MNNEMNTLRGNNLINEILAFIVQGLLFVFFTWASIKVILSNSPDSFTIGLFCLIGVAITLLKTISTFKRIKEQITDIKTENKIVITIGNIGHLIYCFVFITVVGLFVNLIKDKTESIKSFIILIVIEAILGAILIYVDNLLVTLHKNNKIIDINITKNE